MAIKKHNGHLGTFEYEDTIFSIANEEYGSLIYIGDETDGRKIKIPEGVKDISRTFIHTDIKTPPIIPDGVEKMNYTFMNTELTEMPYIPNSVQFMDYCFADNKDLTVRTTLPYNLQSSEGVFDGCPNSYKIVNRDIVTNRPNLNVIFTDQRYAYLRRYCSIGYLKA